MKRQPKYKKALWYQIKHGNKKQKTKRQLDHEEYLKLRKKFLSENPYCQVCAVLRPDMPKHASEDLHHKRGRGKYLLAEETFVATCRYAHNYIHRNPTWAMEYGFMQSRLSREA